jgi:hypothetical protein
MADDFLPEQARNPAGSVNIRGDKRFKEMPKTGDTDEGEKSGQGCKSGSLTAEEKPGTGRVFPSRS